MNVASLISVRHRYGLHSFRLAIAQTINFKKVSNLVTRQGKAIYTASRPLLRPK